ncbi:MAG: lipoate--protein ligase [Bacilli bacterium]|nr:lipoate--protein ligase [Bacilli bacterium]
MLTIINKKTDPRYNLALEEYVLKNLPNDNDYLFLWQNEPAIIIGRNQNTIEEINTNYVEEHNIHVVRRISGGGAVYHDFGNLNYTFVTTNSRDNLNNFRKFTEPVIKALNSLGVDAQFAGRNDILIDGKKFSGNAQTYYKDRMYHHGTILFDADLDMVAKVLQVKLEKIESKGIKSNRSRVTNILPFLKKKMTTKEFQDYLLKFILETDDIESKTYHLTEEDYQKIDKLMKEKYSTWEWNYGENPDFAIQKEKRFAGGKVSFNIDVSENLIKNVKIFGDFFGRTEISKLENVLVGVKFQRKDVLELLGNIDIEEYFYNITKEDIISLLFD